MHMKLKQQLNLTSSVRTLQSLKCASRSKFYEFAHVPGIGLRITLSKKKNPHWLIWFFLSAKINFKIS